MLTPLAEHPMAGPQVAGKPYRFFVTRRYRYRLANVVQGERVEVVDILHPRQDLP